MPLRAQQAWRGVAGLLLAGTALLAGASEAAAAPAVLLRTPGRIDEVVFDRGRAAWIELNRRETCALIVRGDLARGTRAPRTACRRSLTGTPSSEMGPIALAGRRVTFVHRVGSLSETWTRLFAVTRYRQVAQRGWVAPCSDGSCTGAGGTVLGALAGGRRATVFARLQLAPDPACTEDECPAVYAGGDVRRVAVHGRELQGVRIPGAPAPALLDVAAGRLALAPLLAGERTVVAKTRVELRRVDSGALRAAITPGGTPFALALSRDYLAVVVAGARRMRLELYRVPSGEPVATAPVRADIEPSIAVAAGRVAYHVRGAIRLWDATRGRVHTVATVRRPIIGLAIERGRVLWARNRGEWPHRHGEIVSVPVPRRR